MNKIEKLELVYNSGVIDKAKRIEALENGLKSSGFWFDEERKALYHFFIKNDISQAKNHFYMCGKIDEFETNKLDQPILSYGINHFSYALLSDNAELINAYADLSYSRYEKDIKRGGAVFCFIMQCIIKEDWERFNWAMEIARSKTVKRYPLMRFDLQCFEGIVEQNKQKVEDGLRELTTPRVHKLRNRHNILLLEFISHPALGYAKLAWLKGIGVEVSSPLIPKELLPVKPLDTYINEYAFLDEIQLPG